MRAERSWLTPAQARIFLDAVVKDRLAALNRTALSLGTRQGKLVASVGRTWTWTPAWITFVLISAEVRPHIHTVRPGSDVPELRTLYDPSVLVRFALRGDAHERTELPDRGWLCAAVSAVRLQQQFPERSVELIRADIEQLATMGLLEIHRVRLNGEATHVLKVGEWQFDTLFENC